MTHFVVALPRFIQCTSYKRMSAIGRARSIQISLRAAEKESCRNHQEAPANYLQD